MKLSAEPVGTYEALLWWLMMLRAVGERLDDWRVSARSPQ